MKTCRICGEIKELKDFFKIKHLYKYCNLGRRVWCRDCQKMFVEMKKKEEQSSTFQGLHNQSFIVSFS